MKSFSILLSLCMIISCKEKNNTANVKENVKLQAPLSKADSIVNKAIKAHGGKLYENANFSFTFRKNKYSFKNKGSNYTYNVSGIDKEGNNFSDELKDGIVTHKIDTTIIRLSPEEYSKHLGALNSVIYFATLPYKLNDAAVNKKYMETTNIKGEFYHTIEVTFNKQDGGMDHEDQFYYWINTKTYKIDYLAYNYKVNKGGVRFRSFYNRRVIEGITFQDYINWKANVGTPLKELPQLYENGKLKELSRIETENVISLKNL